MPDDTPDPTTAAQALSDFLDRLAAAVVAGLTADRHHPTPDPGSDPVGRGPTD